MSSSDSSGPVIKRVKQEASVSRPSLQYRIQFVDESMIEEAAVFMIEHFLPNDNLDRSLGTIDDDEAIDEAYSDWKMLLSKGISLAAILEDDEGRRDRMISCNVLEIQKKEQPPPPAERQRRRSVKQQQCFQTHSDVQARARADIFSLYSCGSFVRGLGLAVAAGYQRRRVGEEMLRARAQVCRLHDAPVSAAVFTGEASQRLAERCGYETVAELNLTTYRIDGQIVYARPEWALIKWMARRYF